jgi:glutathione S-transferase
MKLYDYLPSQNGWKIRTLLHLAGRELPTEYVSIFEGAGRGDDFLNRNPMGAVPVLELDDGRSIAESNAILVFLAQGTPYLPSDPVDQARVLQWLFFEQNYVEPVIGSLRYWALTGRILQHDPAVIAQKQAAGERALEALDRHLVRRDFLADDRFGIADIAVYAYSHLAQDAHLSLASLPNFGAWTRRVATQAELPPVVPYSVDPHSMVVS